MRPREMKTVSFQKCLDKNPLYLADNPSSYKYYVPDDTEKSAVLNYQVLLPKGLTCKQCVVQWTYKTGREIYFLLYVLL